MGTGPQGHELASLGDLLALVVEGWRIERMHYADRSQASGPPAAFFDLRRGPDEWRGVFVPDDGRALSHRSLVELFRESPEVWKYRSSEAIAPPGPEAGEEPEAWGAVIEPFPDALVLTPATLRSVLPVCQTQTVNDIDLCLVALERHDEGARLTYMCRPGDREPVEAVALLDALAVDDLGRRYRVACLARTFSTKRRDGSLLLAPALPDDARRLTVTVGTVWEGGAAGPGQTSGPWVFPIPLARPASA